MELNQEWLQRACEAFDAATGQPRNAVAAAIEAYIAEMFKPGQVQMLEPLEAMPKRDYRAELWLGVAIAATTNRTGPGTPAEQANNAVRAFDKTFPPEPIHG